MLIIIDKETNIAATKKNEKKSCFVLFLFLAYTQYVLEWNSMGIQVFIHC